MSRMRWAFAFCVCVAVLGLLASGCQSAQSIRVKHHQRLTKLEERMQRINHRFEAVEEGVSLNQLVVTKLALQISQLTSAK